VFTSNNTNEKEVKNSCELYVVGALIIFLLLSSIVTSCSTIKIGAELIAVDFDGNALLNNEVHVKEKLLEILLEHENYTMTGFTRKAISPKVERTLHHYHSFYIVSFDENRYFALSFSGTKKWFRSTGAWAINTNTDVSSYLSYLYDNNEWDVQEIHLKKGINTEMTLKNIIHKIDDDNITYYYNDHINDENNMENCNTALQNTLVEKD